MEGEFRGGLLNKAPQGVDDPRLMVEAHVEGGLAAVFQVGVAEGLFPEAVDPAEGGVVVLIEADVEAEVRVVGGRGRHHEGHNPLADAQLHELSSLPVGGVLEYGEALRRYGGHAAAVHAGEQREVEGEPGLGVDPDGLAEGVPYCLRVARCLENQVLWKGLVPGKVLLCPCLFFGKDVCQGLFLCLEKGIEALDLHGPGIPHLRQRRERLIGNERMLCPGKRLHWCDQEHTQRNKKNDPFADPICPHVFPPCIIGQSVGPPLHFKYFYTIEGMSAACGIPSLKLSECPPPTFYTNLTDGMSQSDSRGAMRHIIYPLPAKKKYLLVSGCIVARSFYLS